MSKLSGIILKGSLLALLSLNVVGCNACDEYKRQAALEHEARKNVSSNDKSKDNFQVLQYDMINPASPKNTNPAYKETHSYLDWDPFFSFWDD